MHETLRKLIKSWDNVAIIEKIELSQHMLSVNGHVSVCLHKCQFGELH